MFTVADIEAVTEFTRVARMLYPRLTWEAMETEAGEAYLLVYDGTVSWFVSPVPAVSGLVPARWAVISACRGDHLMYTAETPAGALQGATGQLVDYLERAATSAVHGGVGEHLTVDRQTEGVL